MAADLPPTTITVEHATHAEVTVRAADSPVIDAPDVGALLDVALDVHVQ